MGHFIIDLPENKKGDVRFGTVFKKQFSLFRRIKSESKKGYIVQVSDADKKTEYRLFTSQNGEWSKDEDGKSPLDSSILHHIKNAIIEKEQSGK